MRKPIIAGSWYPDDRDVLEKMMDGARIKIAERLVPAAVILPHAGYAYSGKIAAGACSLLDEKNYDRILILAPSHRYPLRGCSVEPAGEVETPFGSVCFSENFQRELSALPHCSYIPEAHANEHSIDIQLPLLRKFLPSCELGGLLLGAFFGKKEVGELGAALKKLLDARTLVVISSDFTHYGRAFQYVPFTDDVENKLKELDLGVLEAFASNDGETFNGYLERTGATVCGAAAMRLVLEMLPENASFYKIMYANSGNMTGDWSHCVGYMTALVEADWKDPAKQAKTQKPKGGKELSAEAGAYLLALAKKTIFNALRQDAPELPDSSGMEAELSRNSGAFVTLNRNGMLRGCIGEIFPRRPLRRVVEERALDAAFHDPRFPALSEGELDGLDIEVSVLTHPEPVASYEEIVVGTHGVVLQKDGKGAVFLPQVATEQGWDLATMLAHLCLKAGLPSNAWRSGCQFLVFKAQIFNERRG